MKLSDIPAGLPASFRTDLAQLDAGVRPAIRSELRACPARELRAWARRRRLFTAVDRDGFFALARRPAEARRLLRIDRRPGPHLVALGRAFGYPACCCLAAARRGEEHIDEWSAEISAEPFFGAFKLINPDGYAEGHALLSHVPCSPRCLPSLRMALAVRRRTRGPGREMAGRQRRVALNLARE